MSKQLNVSLNFTANTAQAKAQMQELQRQLNSLTGSLTSADLPITKEIKEAISETAKLEVALKQSMNTDTGKFDLSKFNDTLKKSGTSLQQLSAKLNAVGPEGRRAFMSLAQSIAAAEIPMKRTNTLLNTMWTTMKNTARWQLSSSALHAFTGALHSAVGYAKDLNKSLNNIRIVTGDSVDDMAKFAEQANKAAKTLGTTTTRYTNAALIYYQQGLSDQEVQERTNATVKMANVTGENAQDVSSYMTAIWNNFDDGSKSLEYFADVITKLGAETAASSKEIAGGLEKFAAIGETVGLSYEYATAALTTIIDKTRQSEDVVGTALKTIFARIQGLKMGEETEDGLDLNKYSAALAQYGIDIFDANRNLKDMDVILDEMGAKWETLNRAQKVGLAQTVAGVRQYNQLVSLMDNWDAMEQNVQRAESSSGSLDKQAEIYEESWEAASNRVRAALESIYSDLLDDEFLIDMMNGLEKIISGVDSLIDSVGGLKGVLAGVSAIVFKLFSSQITTGLQNMVYSLTPMKVKQAQAEKVKQQALGEVHKNANYDGLSLSDQASLDALGRQLSLQEKINSKKSELNELQRIEVEQIQEKNNLLQKNYSIAAKEKDVASNKLAKYELETGARNSVLGTDQQKQMLSAKQKGDFTKAYQDTFLIENEIEAERTRIQLKEQYAQTLVNGSQATEKAQSELREHINLIAEDIEKTNALTTAETKAKEGHIDAYNKVHNMPIQPPDYSAIFVNAASAASSLAFGISAISQAFETLKDPDMEWGEKLSSISTSLLMMLPGLITGIKGLSTARTQLIAKMLTSISTENAETAAKVLNGKVSATQAAKIGAETAATEAGNAAKSKSLALSKALNVVAKLSLGHLALIAAAIWAVVKVVDILHISQKELSEQFDTYEEAADKAKSLKDELEGVNNSIDDLLSKGLSQLTDEEEEQLEVLRKQRLELENQLALAEKIADAENEQFAKDFEKRSRQHSYAAEEMAFFIADQDISSRESGIEGPSLTSIKSYETDKIAEYAANLEKAFENNQVTEANYNFLRTKIDEIEKDNAERAEKISEDYELAKGYLSSDYAKEDTKAYNDAIAAVQRYYSYLGDSVNYKKDLIDLYGVSEEDLTEAQGRYEDLTELEKSSFYDKIEQMSKETGLSVEFLADKLGLLEESAHKLGQSDVFDNLRALFDEGEGKEDSQGKKLNGDDILKSQSFNDGQGNSIDLGEGNSLESIFENSGLSVQEQQDILLNIGWEDQTQAESIIQALQQIEELTSDQSMVQEAVSLGYSEEQFEAMTAGIMRTNEAFADNEKLAKQAAIYQMRLSKAIDEGAEIWDDYGDALEEADETNSDYYEGLGALAETFTENLGFEVDWSDIEDNLDLVKKAMEGDADAAAELAQQLAFDSIDTKLDELVESDLTNLQTQLRTFGSELPTELQGLMNKSIGEIQAGWEHAQAFLDDNNLEIGAYIENDQIYEELNNMIAASGMTADEAQSYLSSIGYEGEIDTHEVTMPGSESTGEVQIGPVTIPYTFRQNNQTISVPFIKDSSLKKTSAKTGLKNVGSGSQSKGGGGSKKSTNEKERYHVVSNQVDSLTKSYESISAARENAFGQNKLDLYDDEINALQSIIDKNEAYLDQIETNLSSDKSIMDKYGAKYDEQGNITNYDKLFDEHGQKEQFQKDLDQYEETLELYQDKKKEIADDKINKSNLIYDRIVYKLEVKLDVSDMERDWLDYEFDAISDDVFKSAEAFGFLQQQVNVSQQSLNALKTEREDLQRAFEAGEITEEKYLEGLKNNREETINNLKALDDYDEQMKEYYENTLENAKDKLEEFTEGYENLNAVLEHYKTILELTGQEQDYDKMGAIYEAQRNVALNEQASAQQWFEEQKRLQERLEKEYMENPSEITKKALEAQRKVTMAAQLELFEAAEKTAESINNIYENEMNKLKEQLEKDFTGGLGFDRLNESMRNVSEVQSEYLTETNKLYETNKMLRNIQGDIDKTSNAAAKQRLNNFAKEIEQLQQKGKLSNLELEIAQAKYKQLQAQIALEEAQNAKSIVRLSRDNEGNYGYVYTADQDAISSAEQDLADAENDLYNIRLNAANEYGEKAIQAREELYEKLAEIDLRYEKDTVEWQKATEAAVEEYYDKMDTYTDLYKIAQMEDSEILKDAWVGSYDSIILRTEDVKKSVDKHILGTDSKESSVKGIFNAWKDDMKDHVTKSIGTDLNTLKNKTKKVSAASKELSGKVTELIKKLGKEIEKTQDAIIKHGKNEQSLKNLQTEYKNLATEIQGVITKYSELKEAAKQAREEQEKKVNIPTTTPTTTTTTSGGGGGGGTKPETKPETKKTFKQRGYIDSRETFFVGSGSNNKWETIEGSKYLKTSFGYIPESGLKLSKEKSTSRANAYTAANNTVPFYQYFDTGGYTGKWGPEGKLAMLHEKELVLNKEDTANMLKMVEIVRAMIDANVMNSIATNLHSPGVGTQNQNLEQNVTITAEFPNATDHNEIKMAFESLVNKASQYANRIR